MTRERALQRYHEAQRVVTAACQRYDAEMDKDQASRDHELARRLLSEYERARKDLERAWKAVDRATRAYRVTRIKTGSYEVIVHGEAVGRVDKTGTHLDDYQWQCLPYDPALKTTSSDFDTKQSAVEHLINAALAAREAQS